jgi:hypothetical protein
MPLNWRQVLRNLGIVRISLFFSSAIIFPTSEQTFADGTLLVVAFKCGGTALVTPDTSTECYEKIFKSNALKWLS